jgi:ATP-binding cassette subfamily C (CFTR/MRP) protein 1
LNWNRKPINEEAKKTQKKLQNEAKNASPFGKFTGGKRYFLNSLLVAFGKPYLAAFFLRLIRDLLVFVPPIFLRKFIEFSRANYVTATSKVSHNKTGAGVVTVAGAGASSGHKKIEIWKGYFFAVSLFIIVMIQTLMFQHYFQFCVITGMRVRSAIISAIYQKSLKLSQAQWAEM